jgi:transposase
MDRTVLAELDPEALIALILQQQALIEQLSARVAELEAKLGGPSKTSANSSVPPSQGFKPNRAERRRQKRGPKRGHLGCSRRRQTPDVVVRCRPHQCAGCGATLPVSGQRRVGRSQVVELPPIHPVVIEAWQYAARCRGCGTRTKGTYPAGLEPQRTFGPGIETLLAYLHERHHVGYERLVEACRDLFRLDLSAGAVAAALARLAERARPAYERIGATVRGSPTINSDETGARVCGRTHWHWVFQTPQASYHVLAASRGATVIEQFLAGRTPEVWGSDLLPAQMKTPAAAHQVCLGHQIRDLAYAAEADDLVGRVWAIAVRHQFGRAIELHHRRATLTPEQFTRRKVRIVNAVRRLVDERPAGTGAAAKLQQRYGRCFASLFVFLERDDVEPTNNGSEQDLRPAVVHRKVTHGYRSAWGAEASAIFLSLLATARKQGHNLYTALRDIAGPSPLAAAGLPT